MTDVLVIGAGISGAACARGCADAGLDVRVLDRGHRAGGRMATRTVRDPDHPADLGAPYCTVSDDGFRGVVDGWLARGLLRQWTDTFRTAGPTGLRDLKPGPPRYASVQGMRALVEDLLAGIDVTQQQEVEAVGPDLSVEGQRAEVVVLAMPGPQASRLLIPHHPEVAAIADQPYEPTLALVTRFGQRSWAEFDGAFVADVPEIAWVADDGRSRGDGEPVLVAHSSPSFAELHLTEPEEARPAMLRALRAVLGVHGDPLESRVQRWTYARPTGTREATHHLTADGIGLCSDGWSQKSRVEAAWRSGTDLAATITGAAV